VDLAHRHLCRSAHAAYSSTNSGYFSRRSRGVSARDATFPSSPRSWPTETAHPDPPLDVVGSDPDASAVVAATPGRRFRGRVRSAANAGPSGPLDHTRHAAPDTVANASTLIDGDDNATSAIPHQGGADS
jgi:hypothetical protein